MSEHLVMQIYWRKFMYQAFSSARILIPSFSFFLPLFHTHTHTLSSPFLSLSLFPLPLSPSLLDTHTQISTLSHSMSVRAIQISMSFLTPRICAPNLSPTSEMPPCYVPVVLFSDKTPSKNRECLQLPLKT